MRIIPILKIVTDKRYILCVPFIVFTPKNGNFIRENSEISKMTRGVGYRIDVLFWNIDFFGLILWSNF